jgi:hypothetical protein
MNQLFITNKAYARKADDSGAFTEGTYLKDIDGTTAAKSLMKGSIIFVTDRGQVLVDGTTGGILADVKYVRCYRGMGYGYPPRQSMIMTRDGAWNVSYENYQSPLKQKVFIGSEGNGLLGDLNLPSPLIPTGNESLGYAAEIMIQRTDLTMEYGDNSLTKYFQVPIPESIAGGTATQQKNYIVTQLVSQINATNRYGGREPFVVATAVLNGVDSIGIQLEAKEYGMTFNVSALGLLEYADKITYDTSGMTNAVAHRQGCGRPYMVKDLERKAFTEQGMTDLQTAREFAVWQTDYETCTDDGCGYEMLKIYDSKGAPERAVGELMQMAINKPNLVIAIEGALTPATPAGTWAASDSNIKSILDTLLPTIFGAPMYVAATSTEPATDIS